MKRGCRRERERERGGGEGGGEERFFIHGVIVKHERVLTSSHHPNDGWLSVALRPQKPWDYSRSNSTCTRFLSYDTPVHTWNK